MRCDGNAWCACLLPAIRGAAPRRTEPDAERQGAAVDSEEDCTYERPRRACAPLLTVTRGPEFSRGRLLGMARSQPSSLLSRCGMNLLRMSSELGGVRLPTAAHRRARRFSVLRDGFMSRLPRSPYCRAA